MSNIRIPDQHRQTFFEIAKLPDLAITELFSILETISPAIKHQDAVMRALDSTKQISSKDARAIAAVLLSVYSALEYSGKRLNVFMEELIESLYDVQYEKSVAPAPAPDPEEKQILSDKLTKLLSIPSIRLISKATSVVFDCDNILKHARVLTDIRPIFGYDDTDSILGSVIVQTLKLEYVKDDEEKEFYVSLDNQDVDNLITMLQRAKHKADQSRDLLKEANVTYIPMEQE